jgi:hypothetical protein
MTLAILINVWILVYLVNLERLGCACALGLRRLFIMAYTVLTILMALGLVVLSPESSPLWVSGFVILSIFYIVVVLQYTRDLERHKCACSAHLARDVLQLAAMIQAMLYIFTFILALLVAVTGGGYYSQEVAKAAVSRKK